MKYVIVYWSRYGNGKKAVEYLSETLKRKPAETQIFTTEEADPTSLPDADAYVFSAPAEAFRIQTDMRKFMKNLEGVGGKKFGIINTHGMKRNWLGSMEKMLSKKNMTKAAAVDFRVDGDPKTGDALPDGWQKSIDEFAQQL
jgi:flavodoxin